MYDATLVRAILEQIHTSCDVILRRFASVGAPEDFINSERGMERLDAICMQLIAIGESAKNLDKVSQGTLLNRYPQVEWKRIMGMRDVLSHHYFDMDAEVVYGVCATHIRSLQLTVEQMLDELASSD